MGLEPLARGQSLRDRIRERLIDLLATGTFAPGEAVSEAEIARGLDVSRTPVREALLLLVGQGLLESVPARGFAVRRLEVEEAEQLYPVLGSLEALAVENVAALDPSARTRLDRIAAELAACRDPRGRWELDSAWHTTLTECGGNEFLDRLCSQIRVGLARYELAYMVDQADRHRADAQHDAILAALDEGDPSRAGRLVRTHWSDGRRAVVHALGAAGLSSPS